MAYNSHPDSGKSAFSVKKLVIYAMLSALCVVLAFFGFYLGDQKITFESFPVILAGFLYGPVAGAIVGALGQFIFQMLEWGIEATTVFWILPYVICGIIAGIGANLAKKVSSKKGDGKVIKLWQSIIICLASLLMVSVLNTLAQGLTDWVYGGNLTASVVRGLAGFPLKLVINAAKAIAFGLILPPLVAAIKRIPD